MRLMAVLVGVLVAAVLAVGCGGGSSSGTSGDGSTSGETAAAKGDTSASGEETGSTEGEEGSTGATGAEGGSQSGPLTKKQFVKEAEAICQKIPATYGEKVKAFEEEAKKKGQKPTTSENNLKAAVPADYVAIEELEALSPPQGDEQKVEAIIQSLENAAKGLEAKPESELSGPKSPYAEWQKLTKEYGLKVCSTL